MQYEVFNLHSDGLASASVFIIDKSGQLAWKSISQRYSDKVPSQTILTFYPAPTDNAS